MSSVSRKRRDNKARGNGAVESIGAKLAHLAEHSRGKARIRAAQLTGLAQVLTEAIDDVIGARSNDAMGLECFADALSKLRGVRFSLQQEAKAILDSGAA